jgi:photosystem II stability/assembly factor-like uncharacterized protein
VYAGSKLGGVFASENSGTSWRAANDGITDLRIQCLAVSPGASNVVFAGAQSGGFTTVNGGATWTPLGGGFPSDVINSIAIDPSNAAILYATGPNGVLVKSTSGGAQWSPIGDSTVTGAVPRIVAIDPSHTSTLYLGTLQGGIFRSDDGGATWTPKNEGFKDTVGNPFAASALAVDPTNSSRLWAGTVSNGLYLSTDGGTSWTQEIDGIGLIALVTQIVFASDGTVVESQQQGLYSWAPGATAWSAVGAFSFSNYINSIAIGPGAGPTLYLGYGKFPFESGGFAYFDGSTFRPTFIPVSVVTALAVDPGDRSRALAATTGGAVEYVPGSGPDPWQAVSLGVGGGSNSTSLPPVSLFFDARTPGLVFAGGAGVAIKSIDGGRTTASTAAVGDPTVFPLKVVRTFLAQPGTSQGVFAGTSGGLFVSGDAGASWTAGSTDLRPRQIYTLALDLVSGTTVWAGTDDGVYRSTDSGGHFGKTGSLSGNVHAVLPISGSRIAAAADSGLFVSSDAGATWNPASGAAATTFNALVEDPTTGWLYAGSLAGIFRSQDAGGSWTAESDGLTNPDVLCLAVLGDGSVLAGTNGGSVFLLERILTAPRGRVARAGEDHSPHVVSPRP